MSSVVITGTGVISPAGTGTEPILELMDSGATTLAPGATGWPVGSVRLGESGWPEGQDWANIRKYANGPAHGAVAAARLAVERAGTADPADATRGGIIMAVGSTGADELTELLPKLAVMAATDTRPLTRMLFEEVPDYSYIRGIPSQIGQFVSKATGFEGSNVAVYGEVGAGGFGALSMALRLIESGELDRVLVVGVASPLSAAASVLFDRADPLGTEAVPGRGPFDVGRAGTFPGQAAVAVMLERVQVAELRGVPPLATLLACETIGATSRAAALDDAVGLVLDRAGAKPGLWWAHGAGSVAADADECQIVGGRLDGPVTASKGTIGNPFECSGLVDVALAVAALHRDRIPPVGLLQKPDPALGEVDLVHGSPRAVPGVGSALVTTLSHGESAPTAGAAVITRKGM